MSRVSPGSIASQLANDFTSTIHYIDRNELTKLDHRTHGRVIINCKPICKATQTVNAIFGTIYGHDRKQLISLVDMPVGHGCAAPPCSKIIWIYL